MLLLMMMMIIIIININFIIIIIQNNTKVIHELTEQWLCAWKRTTSDQIIVSFSIFFYFLILFDIYTLTFTIFVIPLKRFITECLFLNNYFKICF